MNVNKSISFIGARPDGWSPERYDAAAKHLATWDVDFEWTIAQHEAGASFAAKNCKKDVTSENPFQNLCAANDSAKAIDARNEKNNVENRNTSQRKAQ